ncbi:hypothetical protein CC79DRAFT_543038 [Sarocladium strictum]
MKFPIIESAEQVGSGEALRRPNWKPFVFSPLFILPLSILHVLAIVGIQLLIKQHDKRADDLALIRSNRTLDDAPSSIFIFEEDDTTAFMGWAYLPVAIAVILSFGWEALDAQMRRLEPFRQLASKNGGTAFNALCVDYTTLFGLFTPFQAFSRRHFTLALSSTLYVIASIAIPALASGMFNVEWGSLSFSLGRNEGPKYAVIEINRAIALTSQVLHGIILAGGLIVSALLFFRPSGLYHDPGSIGGLAALISDGVRNGSSVATILRQIPSYAHSKVVQRALGDIVFRLEHDRLPGVDGDLRTTYQLTTDVPQHTILHIDPQDRRFYGLRRDASGYWLMRRSAWLAEVLLWFSPITASGAIFAIIKFVSGESTDTTKPFVAKIVLNVFVTIGSMMWTSIQRDIQLFAPWRSLSKPPERKLSNPIWWNDPVAKGQFGSAAFGLTRGYATILWASYCVLTTQAVAVFMPPIIELAWTSGLTQDMDVPDRKIGILTGSSGLGLGASGVAIHLVVFLNLLIFTLSTVWRPFLPRAPTTIASQLLYLCRSERLLRRFEATSMTTGKELAGLLKSSQGQCLFGWFWWREGGAWCVGIEEHEQGAPWYPFDFQKGVSGAQPTS